jgi:hypothetical protein
MAEGDEPPIAMSRSRLMAAMAKISVSVMRPSE